MRSDHSITVISHVDLDFPSASAITFFEGVLYIIGDDASSILVLDSNYKLIKKYPIFRSAADRISKAEKADLEASAIVQFYDLPFIIAFGSGSANNRQRMYLFPLKSSGEFGVLDMDSLIAKMKAAGLHAINIEGAAVCRDRMILGNRANFTDPVNHFISMPVNFFGSHNYEIKTAELKLPFIDSAVIGISGMDYIPGQDLLVFTASVEHTANAYDDGEIGNSYLGYIKEFSSKTEQEVILTDGMIDLEKQSPVFKQMKIESVCFESVNDGQMILHLVADNDNGRSSLFKIKLPANLPAG